MRRCGRGPLAAALSVSFGILAIGCASGPRALRPPAAFGGVAGPLIVAHQGGGGEATENTLAAVARAVAAGADWQEVEVTLARDREAVLLAAEPPQTLDELLAVPDARLVIALRPTAQAVPLVEKVIAAVHRARAADRVAFASSRIDVLDAAYAREPSIPLVGLVEKEEEIEEMLLLPIVALAVPFDLLEAARTAAPLGLAMWSRTADSVAMAEEAVALGAHAVITDVPAAVVRAFRTPPPLVLPLSR